ncbi:MAG TPA: hypothetical protein VGG72_02190 [Bryobacteraceae bacterium]|jgi:hypothetical protein
MVHQERLRNGHLKVTSLANFQARIVRDLVFDDGDQEKREFEVEAKLGDTAVTFSVCAAEFGRMGWVLGRLGPQAIIYPGQQQHARAAIQSLSGQIRQERVFTHLGWRKEGTQWLYLHNGGALGPDGQSSTVQVRLPAALQAYEIRQPGVLMNAHEQSATAYGFYQSPLTELPSHFWLARTGPRLETRGLVSFSSAEAASSNRLSPRYVNSISVLR